MLGAWSSAALKRLVGTLTLWAHALGGPAGAGSELGQLAGRVVGSTVLGLLNTHSC